MFSYKSVNSPMIDLRSRFSDLDRSAVRRVQRQIGDLVPEAENELLRLCDGVEEARSP
jgi:hypothetical protein